MTEPLDLDAIQARADAATGGTWRYESYAGLGPNGVLSAVSIPIGRFDFGAGDQADADRAFVFNAHQDVTALLTEIRRLRAELEQYTALELAYTDGRISATCDNSRHPTWLRSPDDTRGCPWCELDQTRQQSESCDHESWEAGPRRLIGRKAVQSRRCVDCGEQLAPMPYTSPAS